MPANKNALIRYKTIDNCLRKRYRRWTLHDLVDACSDALYDMEGIANGVSVRTIQNDLQVMRSDKLGYNAPIEVYDHKYYRYSDPDYSIMNMPMSENEMSMLQEAVDMLQQLEAFDDFAEMTDVIGRLQEKLAVSRHGRKPVINFDNVPDLKGLKLLNPLYQYILRKQTLRIMYQSFKAREPREVILYPYLLKEFRNRWFLFGSQEGNLALYNLALDRIVSVEPCKEKPFRDNPAFDPYTFFDDVIGVSKNIGNKPKNIRFWASAEQCQYIATKPIHHSQQLIKRNEDGSCEFKIKVVINYEMYSVFMSYGPGIKIISPNSAVLFMKNKLQAAAEMYTRTYGTTAIE